jgi:cation diffusion facilitator CzcD-associated flavoprotein CzcO
LTFVEPARHHTAAMVEIDVDVLVVGAGPTGLALAFELRRHGLRCRLVD